MDGVKDAREGAEVEALNGRIRLLEEEVAQGARLRGMLQSAADELRQERARSRDLQERVSGANRELQQRLAELEEIRASQESLITRLHEAQEQLLQLDKMAAIGQLAAGVAHEINNPVGYIYSNLSSLKGYADDIFRVLDSYAALEAVVPAGAAELAAVGAAKKEVDLPFLRTDLDSLIAESEEGVVRVKQIVQDLKDFSHIDDAEWQWADLHKGLDSTLNVVHNELKYKAQVSKEYAQLPRVRCLPSQLNQVFMNLLVNAGQALEDHGEITVRTGMEDDETVWIEVADNGKGILPADLKRIFEPFFTTKPVGKGTGLGLSLSYSIVAKHKGRIEVQSEVGKGTRFRVLLPVEGPGAEAEQAATDAVTAGTHG